MAAARSEREVWCQVKNQKSPLAGHRRCRLHREPRERARARAANQSGFTRATAAAATTAAAAAAATTAAAAAATRARIFYRRPINRHVQSSRLSNIQISDDV